MSAPLSFRSRGVNPRSLIKAGGTLRSPRTPRRLYKILSSVETGQERRSGPPASTTEGRGRTAAAGLASPPMSHCPENTAPSSITSFGETRLAWTLDPASSSMRWRPFTRPVTVPRIDTTPQSISASTLPDSPTISVCSETTLPVSRPSMRKVSWKRSSPWNSVPSSMKPLRSSLARPLSLIIRLLARSESASVRSESAEPRLACRLPSAPGPEQQLVDPLQLRFRRERHTKRARLAAAHDLDSRPQRRPQALLGRPRVGVAVGAPARPRRPLKRHAALDLPHRQPL